MGQEPGLGWLEERGDSSQARLEVVALAAEVVTLDRCLADQIRGLRIGGALATIEESESHARRARLLLAADSGLERLSGEQLRAAAGQLRRDRAGMMALRQRLVPPAGATSRRTVSGEGLRRR